MHIGAVIVAAEESRRLRELGQLMEETQMPPAERVVTNFRRAGIRDIVVVIHGQGEEIRRQLRKTGVVFLESSDEEHAQMLDLAKLGIRYLCGRCERVFFTPAGVPFFREETLRAMLQAAGQADVLIPSCGGHGGHPLLLSRRAMDFILTYEGEDGLRGACRAMEREGRGTRQYLLVEDEGAVMRGETPGEERELLWRHSRQLLRPEVSLTLCRERPFFSEQTAALLVQIRSLGSVREACEKCGISYSRGRALIGACEAQLGLPIVLRRQGGRGGGEAQVTAQGEELLARYESLQEELSALARERFSQIFAGFGVPEGEEPVGAEHEEGESEAAESRAKECGAKESRGAGMRGGRET